MQSLHNSDIEIRPLEIKDAPDIFALTNKNRVYLRRTLPWLDGISKQEDTENFISSSLKKQSEGVTAIFGIWYQGKIVGVIDLHKINEIPKSAHVGYWIDQEFQGKGIVTESVSLLIGYGFNELGLDKIEIRCSTINPRSAAVAERLGFTKERVLPQAATLYGNFEDMEVWSLLKRE